MTQLIIIRHGQASFGASDYDRLSDTGAEQSRILGRWLAHTGTVFDKVMSGTMSRQTETARLALGEMGPDRSGPVTDPAFDEYDYKAIIGALLPGLITDNPAIADLLPRVTTDNRAFQKMFAPIMDRWVSGRYETPGTESFDDYVNRVTRGLLGLADAGDGRHPAAVFTSGGVIAVAVKLALGLSNTEAMRLAWWIRNTSMTTVSYGRGRFNLMNFNVLSHLDKENRPDLLTFR
ncbi:histidine phosphatase family protein [Desulfatiferula olefinivorans]